MSRPLAAAVIFGVGLISGIAGTGTTAAHAQQSSSRPEFDIPAGPLAAALVSFGQQANLQVSYSPEIATGKNTSGANGPLSARGALDRMLAGTGLAYRFTNARTVTIYGNQPATVANAQDGAALPTIDVTGETAWGPVRGFVARQSATGTKTDTPLIETPQSISVVTRDQLDTQQADSIKQALRYTADVSAENRANFASTDIMYSRGFIMNRFLDGLKLQGDTATAMAPQVELYGIERVEVMRGPASVLYGQSSPGGIVNLVTKRPTATPFAEIALQGGNFGRKQAAFDLGGATDKEGKYQFRLTGVARDADNQVDFVKEQRIYIAPAFTWKPTNDTSLTILANYQRDPFAGMYNFVPYTGSVSANPLGKIPTNFYSGDPNYNDLSRTQASIGYLLEHHFNDVWAVRQNMRYQDMTGTLNQILPFGLDPDNRTLYRAAETANNHIQTLSLDTNLEAKFQTGPLQHKVLFGIDFSRTRMVDNSAFNFTSTPSIDLFSPTYYQAVPMPSPSDPNVDLADQVNQVQRQVGLYAQEQLKIGNLTLVFSGRSDRAKSDTNDIHTDNVLAATGVTQTNTSQNDSAFTKRIGAVYQFSNGIAPYAVYATSFNPTLGTDINGTPFKPTMGRLYEAGVKFQPTGFNSFVQTSVFDVTQQNVLTVDPTNSNFNTQTGEVRSRGFEFEGKLSLTDQLNLTAAYARINPEVTASNGTDLGKIPVNIPRNTASAWADYTFRGPVLGGLGIGFGVRYIGETYADGANLMPVNSYTVADAIIRYDFGYLQPRLKGLQFSINALNLFDHEYVSNCSTDNCVYGLRRQVMGTLKYRY